MAVRQRAGKVLGYSGAETGARAACGIRAVGGEVEGAQSDSDLNAGGGCPDARNHFAQEARAILERASERPFARDRAQELVSQVAVAVLDVYEVGATAFGDAARPDEQVDNPPHLVVAQDRIVLRNAELAVQEWVAVEDLGFEARLAGSREAARVGELKPRQQVRVRTEIGVMYVEQFGMQSLERVLCLRPDHELARVGAAVGCDGHRLAAPDALGTAMSEVAPASAHQLVRLAVVVAVPALHRMDHEAIAERLPSRRQWLG